MRALYAPREGAGLVTATDFPSDDAAIEIDTYSQFCGPLG